MLHLRKLLFRYLTAYFSDVSEAAVLHCVAKAMTNGSISARSCVSSTLRVSSHGSNRTDSHKLELWNTQAGTRTFSHTAKKLSDGRYRFGWPLRTE
jgi:hypothetical protein